jgi:hypothetical protein
LFLPLHHTLIETMMKQDQLPAQTNQGSPTPFEIAEMQSEPMNEAGMEMFEDAHGWGDYTD